MKPIIDYELINDVWQQEEEFEWLPLVIRLAIAGCVILGIVKVIG